MLLSKGCEHGLRSMLYLSLRENGEYVSIREIGDALDISSTFLTKVFQELNDAGLVDSRRGRYGGVTLAREPDGITLYQIVAAVDGESLFTECVLGLPGCGKEKPCPLHREWARQRDQLELMFRRMTMKEMADRAIDRNIRITAEAIIDEMMASEDREEQE
ncbi:Rrf2 family transcriptional regulator [Longibacter salinarum]|uniref:Rrf2 family transcriptional regulator n=2 Tax=Longibacter salinarum TaxID=1850348 RepID=A0A2A8CU88_9BACT|nr:Rrf2 family transcriptional regulator [Longibacter salinarum]